MSRLAFTFLAAAAMVMAPAVKVSEPPPERIKDVRLASVRRTTPKPPPNPVLEELPLLKERQALEAPERSVWDDLADCESGDWDRHRVPIQGTARWGYGYNQRTHAGYSQFEGGLNFHPKTWDSFKPEGYPDHAGMATREMQILVGEKVLAVQGWGAWPNCSRMLGLR